MNTRDLLGFIIVFEERSINQAARKLFISPQGLSKMITNFEKELGAPLFLRTQKGMEPTESALFLYEKAHAILPEVEQVENGIRQIARRRHGLRIACANGVLNALSYRVI